MIVENISNNDNICKIELTVKETVALLHVLIRTYAKGEQLTMSMELEDKLKEILKSYR